MPSDVKVLMVAEKPSLAQSIAQFLSNGQVLRYPEGKEGSWDHPGPAVCSRWMAMHRSSKMGKAHLIASTALNTVYVQAAHAIVVIIYF